MSQRIAPYLLYADSDAAMAFLSAAFGFEETMRMNGADGRVSHAEMELQGGEIMLGTPAREYRNPAALGGVTQLVHVYVDDVDAHCARARSAGAVIEREPEDQVYGDRTYAAYDPEGHHWYFAQRLNRAADA